MGVQHVHDELTRRLTEQRETVDKLDGKANGLIAFLAVALGAAATIGADVLGAIAHAQTALLILLGLALLCALRAYWPRGWLAPPNPASYATYIHWTQEQADAAVMEAIYAAIFVNADTLARKLRWLDWCFGLLVVAIILFAVTAALHLENIKIGS